MFIPRLLLFARRCCPTSRRLRSIVGPIVAVLTAAAPAVAGPGTQTRFSLQQSIKAIPAGMVSSGALTSAELHRTIEFMVPLKMRNYEELVARVHAGELIDPSELAAKYYPQESDYLAVVNWLTDEGFRVVKKDQNHLGVFVSGTVEQIQRALQISFARVTAENESFVSATSAPSVPAALMPAVLGVNGLQPHIRRHKHSRPIASGPVLNTANQPPYLVNEILGAYGGSGLNVNGSGQKIGIVIDTFPANADLTAFWSRCGIAQSLGNMEFVQVVAGTLPRASGEESLDVEWSSGIAAGAKVRVYAARDLSDVHLDQCYQQILNDLPSQPGLRQISLSYGLGELDGSTSQMQTDAQYFASMAANGVTVFVSSGDGGSNPDVNGNHNGPTQVENPASDPSVTAVGGTSLSLTSGGAISNETVWFDGGGGASVVFNRPSWQNGPGVPSGTKRLVPDVASAADPGTGGLVVLNGSQQQYGGTSWSAPMWAGFSALINQARSNAGLAPLGLLGPKIYPLIGGTAFRDITSGTNGGYSATAGFDLCTGVGTPRVTGLIQALTSSGSTGGSNQQPNLVPNQPNGWSDKIVVSKTTGTSSDATNLQPGDTLYLDWSVINSGSAATAATFSVELYVDGSLRQTWSVAPALAPNNSTFATDFSVGTLAAGSHQFRLKVDSTNAVSESNESDNEYVKTISVGAGSNDDFVDRQAISGNSGTINGSNAGATVESAEPYHAGNVGGSSIWYSWTAPASGPATLDTFQSSFDTLLAVYTGSSLSNLVRVASDDDANNTFQSRVSFNATAGVTYQIAVDGYDGAVGTTVLHWLLTPQTFVISVSSSSASGGSVTGGGNYTSGATATVTAIATNGYTFSNWTENGTLVSTSASYGFSVDRSRTLVANFTAPAANFTITTSSSPSNAGSTSGGGSFLSGTSRTVTATANSGFSFQNWTENGSVVSTSPNYTFTVNGARALVANFTSSSQLFTITAEVTPVRGGTVSGEGSFAAGSNCTLTALPKRRFSFAFWTENGSVVSTSASYSFAVTGSRTLVANFRRR